ncbi:MAG: hypothetical protein F6K22_24545 [Okeania sp. SIO2F4]|uniref:hypothetical protein n=1 Tax=Okeania sp. SIO2F4 TaxID=2607790 RepID=UPI0014293470|nr:hypothetical protein [Okeania sp. SIO2F4]NES05701.1 hypothetical protein [Okeania sp. SIO2F4]
MLVVERLLVSSKLHKFRRNRTISSRSDRLSFCDSLYVRLKFLKIIGHFSYQLSVISYQL